MKGFKPKTEFKENEALSKLSEQERCVVVFCTDVSTVIRSGAAARVSLDRRPYHASNGRASLAQGDPPREGGAGGQGAAPRLPGATACRHWSADTTPFCRPA